MQKIDKARASLLQLEGLIAAFGTPHPEIWDRAVAQADGLLSPAEAAVRLMNQVPQLHEKMELVQDRAEKLDGDPAASYWVAKQGLLQAMQTYVTSLTQPM